MRSLSLAIVIVFLLVGMSCKKEYNEVSKVLVEVKEEKPGSNCHSGGVVVLNGVDINNNQKLDSNEIKSQQYICNGNNSISDKKIVIPFLNYGATTSSISGRTSGILVKFNKLDFSNVDSITFYSSASVYDNNQPQPANAIVELYNITDNVIIDRSKIISSKIGYGNTEFAESQDIYATLPDKDINLGFKISSSKEGSMVQAGYCYLVVYKK